MHERLNPHEITPPDTAHCPLPTFRPVLNLLTLNLPTLYRESSFVGDHSEGGTPSPIPNLVVKPFHAHGSWGASPCESRSSPTKLFHRFRLSHKNGPEFDKDAQLCYNVRLVK